MKSRQVKFILDTPRINPDRSIDHPSPGQGAWYFEGNHLGVLSPYYLEDAVRAAVYRFELQDDQLEIVYPDNYPIDALDWVNDHPTRLPVVPRGRFRYVRPYSELPGVLVPIR